MHPLTTRLSYLASTVVWTHCWEGVGERSLYFQLLQLLTFLIVIDSSSTFIVYWLYVILGGIIIYWLVAFLSRINVGLPLADYTRERVVYWLARDSPFRPILVARKVAPFVWCPSSSPPTLSRFKFPLFLLPCGAIVTCSSTTSKGAKLFSSQVVYPSMSSSFGMSSNWISMGSVWVDLIVYGSKLAGCCNPPLLKEGDGVP